MDSKLQVIQNRLILGGYSVGSAGADGKWGDGTFKALSKAFDDAKIGMLEGRAPDKPTVGPIPLIWLDKAKMSRIICHWTAGSYSVSDIDKEHYHFIGDGNGVVHRGDHSVADNENTKDGDYAAHTLGCNTGSIGVSLACMLNAVESPFKPGPYPMKRDQWDLLIRMLAQLCEHYQIPVNRRTVLSHAEVQGTLGIQQRGKWDYTRLPFDATAAGALAVGDKMRAEVIALMKG